MIAIKSTVMNTLPKSCDSCVWYGSRPHPNKGWTDICELIGHCMDDDQPEGWFYDGDSRPDECPLIEVKEDGR